MSLDHTFSSALPLKKKKAPSQAGSATPVNAIQPLIGSASSCFSLVQIGAVTKILSSFPVACVATDQLNQDIWWSDFICRDDLWANLKKKKKKYNFFFLCSAFWEAATQKITLSWDVCQESQDASCFPLWYTSKLWAVDKYGNTPPQQLPRCFSTPLDEL